MQGQALLRATGIRTVQWGPIVPDTACRWIPVAAPHPMKPPSACHRLLRAVLSLAPHHALTREVWRAMLSRHREWMTNPGARCPPGPVLAQITAPTPGVRHALHRASALTEQLTDEVLDLALEPLRVLYAQTHIPPAGTSHRLGRLVFQRRVDAAHPGGVVEQWLTLQNPSTAQGHWYLHELLFLPRTAPEHRRQNPYDTHPERLGAQRFPQPAPPALPPGQSPEALQQGPLLDTASTVQQTGKQRRGRGQTGPHELQSGGPNGDLQAPRPRYHVAQAIHASGPHSAGGHRCGRHHEPVAAWPAQLRPHVPCRDTQPRQSAATHTPTAPLTAEQLYVVTAALLADGGESFVHHHGPAQIAGSIQGPQRDAPDPWHARLPKRTRVRDASGDAPLSWA